MTASPSSSSSSPRPSRPTPPDPLFRYSDPIGTRPAGGSPLSSPPSASLLLHLDVDVIQQHDMPAAYFAHREGLSRSEAHELVGGLLSDPRLRIVEVSEYASLRDLDQRVASTLVDLLVAGLSA